MPGPSTRMIREMAERRRQNDLKDSGQRRHFDTGSQRDVRTGKGRFDLLPVEALRRVAVIFEKGARKYEERNWEKGQTCGTYMDSGLRHVLNHLAGLDDEDHLAQACWNFLCLLETEIRIRDGRLPPELADFPWQQQDGRDPSGEPPADAA